jgi:hypothetical protein
MVSRSFRVQGARATSLKPPFLKTPPSHHRHTFFFHLTSSTIPTFQSNQIISTKHQVMSLKNPSLITTRRRQTISHLPYLPPFFSLIIAPSNSAILQYRRPWDWLRLAREDIQRQIYIILILFNP